MKGFQVTFTEEGCSYLHLRFIAKLVLTDQSPLLERLSTDKSQIENKQKNATGILNVLVKI